MATTTTTDTGITRASSVTVVSVSYDAVADITKVNNILVSNVTMDIFGSQIKVEGTAAVLKTVLKSDQTEQTTDVTATELDKVNVRFGNATSGAAHQATLTADKKAWSLTVSPIPVGLADLAANLTIEAIPIARSSASPLVITTDKVTVKVDNQPPNLTINKPASGDQFVLTNGTAPVTLEFTVTDNKAVDQSVKWALEKPGDSPPPLASYNTVTLSQGKAVVAVSLTIDGKHTFYVRAADTTGNVAEKSVSVIATQQFRPIDPENVTGLADYFGNLLKFAAQRIRVGGGITLAAEATSPTPSLLDVAFFQRFQDLLGMLSTEGTRRVALQPVNHSRICVDVLRRYISARLPLLNLDAVQTAYRQRAYDALLGALGTAYKELREAVAGEADTRTALAERLRVGPEALAGLLLSRDALTEADLQRVFGLSRIDLIKDPFAPTEPQPPELLDKRRAYMLAAWQTQDEEVRHPAFGITVPVLDPDLAQEDNLKTEKARSLWTDRRQEIALKLNALRAIPRPDSGLPAAFKLIVDTALGAGTTETLIGTENTVGLFGRYGAGRNIEPEIHTLHLETAPFLHLMNFHRMLSNGVKPLNDEWEQVISLLVQAVKLRHLYPEWRRIEKEVIVLRLGPDDFKLPAGVDKPVELPLWRASQSAYQDWLARLAARTDQAATMEEELRSAIEVAEADALPQLRDRLIGLIRGAVNHGENIDTADELTGELFIDFKSANHLKTSRLEQANETLQGILFAVRMGQLAKNPVQGPNPAAAWVLDTINSTYMEKEFDEEWRWMGSYATWLSAMDIFLFPENFLRPAVRPLPPPPGTAAQVPAPQTKAFNALLGRLRQKTRLTRQLARQEASDYLAALKKELFPPDGVVPATSPLKSFFDATQTSLGFQLTEPTSLQQIRLRHTKNNELFNAVFPSGTSQPMKFHDVPGWVQELMYSVPLLLAEQLERFGEYLSAIDWYQAVYAYTEPVSLEQRLIYKGLTLEPNAESFGDDPNWLLADFNPHKIAVTRGKVYARYAIAGLTRCLLAFADDQFTQETAETLPLARSLYLSALDLLDLPQMQVAPQFGTKKLENPLIRSLRDHAESHLRKLRNGLNIAGLERPRSARDVVRAVTRYPTPYRYGVLIERAKQLTQTAAQIEASFLAALEKVDAEQYALLQAQHDIQLGEAKVQLQNLRVTEATAGVTLARRQHGRARIQAEHFERLLDRDLLPGEEAMIAAMKRATVLRAVGGILSIGASVAATFVTGGVTAPAVIGAVAGMVAGASKKNPVSTALGAAGDLAGVAGGLFAGQADVLSTQASFERRRQDWRLQLSLARRDMAIGSQQIKLAGDQKRVTEQELKIAEMQVKHAFETLTFLSNKFTGAELFDWMAQVLENIYAFFLRHAAAIARLAEAQLVYERQEAVPTFIRPDYSRTTEGSIFGNGRGDTDRRGLTGSARLLRDITELDQFAFTTDSRKLQLSKTFSLAALDPVGFQSFVETGVMQFATLMDHYDREFPGHYLRLIKRARVSVIALIPPTQGIRATLSNLGVSRVVIDDNGFRPVVVHHGPQSVALTAPLNATGTFELGDAQPEMLGPFESIGVDTTWEFTMPKPANSFDYDTIADVLLTFDYTAFDSPAYRKQVIENLDPVISSDQPYSLRDLFPDQWYDLHNPEQSDAPMVMRFATTRADFPPNVEVGSIEHLSLVLSVNGETTPEMPAIQLRFREQGSTGALGGEAIPFNGIVSTRRGAENWKPILEKKPIGEWELAFPETMRDLFKEDKIEDMLLVVTYQGRLPAWPA